MALEAVVFDVGETLVNEGRQWSEWAHWLGISSGTFFAGLGAVIARRQDHRAVFDLFRPGFDFDKERKAKEAAGRGWSVGAQDLYPDAVGCLAALRDHGLRVGIAGNQPAGIEQALGALGLPVDFVASSARWGVAKPSPAFFERVVEAAGVAPPGIAYVGDRIDNDVVPARAAGMTAVFLRRGPWGWIQAGWPEAAAADVVVDSLTELPDRLFSVIGPA